MPVDGAQWVSDLRWHGWSVGGDETPQELVVDLSKPFPGHRRSYRFATLSW